MTIRVGTAGWTDPTLLKARTFYPRGVTTAEARLRWYASEFSLVEADAPFYALPSAATTRAWAERTPPGFVFDVKAYALLTGHPLRTAALPPDLRDALPARLRARPRLRAEDTPSEIADEVWARFREGLRPLSEAGKLGAVLMQFPPWLTASRESAGAIQRAITRLGLPASVELRHESWLDDSHRERTFGFLRALGLPYVCVDMPQGFASSLPAIARATSKSLAIVRFHGRNEANWEAKLEVASLRFDHLYSTGELEPWLERIAALAGEADEVHLVMNNCHEDKAIQNARDLRALLSARGLTA